MSADSRRPDKRNVNTWMGADDRAKLAQLAQMLDMTKTDIILTSLHQLYEKVIAERKNDNGNTDDHLG